MENLSSLESQQSAELNLTRKMSLHTLTHQSDQSPHSKINTESHRSRAVGDLSIGERCRLKYLQIHLKDQDFEDRVKLLLETMHLWLAEEPKIKFLNKEIGQPPFKSVPKRFILEQIRLRNSQSLFMYAVSQL